MGEMVADKTPTRAAPVRAPQLSRLPHLLARITAVSVLFLILAGGLVTSTGSGLAVPDWPLSYGQLMPPMEGGVFFEHGHRMIATGVGLLVIALTVGVHLREKRGWVRSLSRFILGGVIIQGILGGITVLYGLPPYVSIIHGCLAQSLFCAVVALMEVTSSGWSDPAAPSAGMKNLRVPALVTFHALFIQLILGASLRHTGSGLALHVLGACAAALVLTWLLSETLARSNKASLTHLAMLLGGLLITQLSLGAGAAALKYTEASSSGVAQVCVATAHVACGALLLALTVVLTLRIYRESRG